MGPKRGLHFGPHRVQRQKHQLLHLTALGRTEGRGIADRKQISWLCNIRTWTGLRTSG